MIDDCRLTIADCFAKSKLETGNSKFAVGTLISVFRFPISPPSFMCQSTIVH